MCWISRAGRMEGVRLPIGDYLWVQGAIATPDISEDTVACKDFSNRVFGACFEKKIVHVNELINRAAKGDYMRQFRRLHTSKLLWPIVLMDCAPWQFLNDVLCIAFVAG